MVHVPVDGGYTFTLLMSAQGSLTIDDLPPVNTPKARPQVCGSIGDAVQAVRVSAVLKSGLHHIRIERTSGIENTEPPSGTSTGEPILLWEGPDLQRQLVPANENSM